MIHWVFVVHLNEDGASIPPMHLTTDGLNGKTRCIDVVKLSGDYTALDNWVHLRNTGEDRVKVELAERFFVPPWANDEVLGFSFNASSFTRTTLETKPYRPYAEEETQHMKVLIVPGHFTALLDAFFAGSHVVPVTEQFKALVAALRNELDLAVA